MTLSSKIRVPKDKLLQTLGRDNWIFKFGAQMSMTLSENDEEATPPNCICKELDVLIAVGSLRSIWRLSSHTFDIDIW